MTLDDAALAVPVSAHDHIQGNPHAVVTLVEYGDFQCPACAMAYPRVKQLQHRHAGNLRLVFRHFPLNQAHPYAQLAAELAEAAAIEGQFWPMHDWLYEHQDDWAPKGGAGLEAACARSAWMSRRSPPPCAIPTSTRTCDATSWAACAAASTARPASMSTDICTGMTSMLWRTASAG